MSIICKGCNYETGFYSFLCLPRPGWLVLWLSKHDTHLSLFPSLSLSLSLLPIVINMIKAIKICKPFFLIIHICYMKKCMNIIEYYFLTSLKKLHLYNPPFLSLTNSLTHCLWLLGSSSTFPPLPSSLLPSPPDTPQPLSPPTFPLTCLTLVYPTSKESRMVQIKIST